MISRSPKFATWARNGRQYDVVVDIIVYSGVAKQLNDGECGA